MECPRCHIPALVVEHDGVELDHCSECGGTWFDSGELALLFAGEPSGGSHAGGPDPESLGMWVNPERIAALPDAAGDEKPRRCPICRTRMRKVNIGPSNRVLIDACPRGHGLWFDDTEVATLAADLSAAVGELPRRAAAFLGDTVGEAAARSAASADHERKDVER
ncbi:MAG: zf-TFIIB domain-containing protein [Candidatus Krumholzibacteriia bacterium]